MNNYQEQYKYVVFKYNCYDSNFYILPLSELPTSGFTSLYCFTPETAEALSSSGIAGYKGTVWSSHLALDFDSEEASVEAQQRLSEMGLEFDMFTTGNRGKHFYIPRPIYPSHNLPQIDKKWVECNFPNADTSIYSALHMFRLPGTKHEKTGNSKSYVYTHNGNPLILSDTVINRQERTPLEDAPKESIFLNRHVMTLTVPWPEGKRHEALVSLGVSLKHLGEPMDFIARWLYHANLAFTEPKEASELERILQFVESAE